MASRRVEAAWTGFSRVVMPADAPPIQIKEMRMAFYAGAWAALQMTKDLGAVIESGAMTEMDGVNVLEEIEQECKQFTERVGVDR
ncbi:hypothetical protein [Pantanalinema sp. GBBB05]|uniref:hypothetical protein n=1 Tax=Pantanalinema sp. GBBB05 TaxID=2604139 RepID=UPI001D3A15AC|nr:hypothetical protein [Pantanalinema sp. GBBB05]